MLKPAWPPSSERDVTSTLPKGNMRKVTRSGERSGATASGGGSGEGEGSWASLRAGTPSISAAGATLVTSERSPAAAILPRLPGGGGSLARTPRPEVVPVEEGVPDEGVATLGLPAPHRVVGEEHHVPLAHRAVHDRGPLRQLLAL